MAVNFVLFTYGWELQHGNSGMESAKMRSSRERRGMGDGMNDPLLVCEERERAMEEDEQEEEEGGGRERGRTWSSHSHHSQRHSHGRCVSIDYGTDAHQEGIEKLRCSSSGGFT